MPVSRGPLDGIRVLDLTRVLSGPYATMLLGDLGAEVIKIELPLTGDDTRHVEPVRDGESHYFVAVNRNKRSVTVDLKSAAGQKLVADLAAKSDVIIENFRPGVAERLGLGYDTLHSANPGLVYCSISAFGHTGPWASRSAFDIAVQALSGFMSVTGEPGSAATRLGIPVADICGGMFAVIGVLSALHEKQRTGEGQFVDSALLDGMVAMLTYLATRLEFTGADAPKIGTGHLGVVPYGAYRASDGDIVIANFGEAIWHKLCTAIGRTDLADDPRFGTNSQRVAHRDIVQTELNRAFASRTVAEWEVILDAHDVPHAPILEVSEVLNHPQVRARGMIDQYDHPTLGTFPAVGRAIRFPNHLGVPLLPPPLLGADNARVLMDVLGLSAAEVHDLENLGALGPTERRGHRDV